MKKPFNGDVKWNFILAAIAGMALGILYLVFPENSGLIVCYICAGLVLLFGIIHIVNYFVHNTPEHIYHYDLTQGLIGLAVGICLFARPDFLLGLLPAVLGIAVIIDSIVKLQNAFDFLRMGYKYWWVVLLLTLSTATLGVLMFVNPFQAPAALITFIGISLIVNALIDFWNVFYLAHFIKKIQKAPAGTTAAAKEPGVGTVSETTGSNPDDGLSDANTGFAGTDSTDEDIPANP